MSTFLLLLVVDNKSDDYDKLSNFPKTYDTWRRHSNWLEIILLLLSYLRHGKILEIRMNAI